MWSISSNIYRTPEQVTYILLHKDMSNVFLPCCSGQWPLLPSSHHQPSLCPAPRPNAEASLLLSTQSCSTPWPRAVPHYRAVRKLLGAPVTLKDWWRKMGWRRGEEQVVKKRMSCLMGCQECNSIIMKSDSGELDGWAAEWLPRGAVDPLNMPEHPRPPGRQKQVIGSVSQKYWRLFVQQRKPTVLSGRSHFGIYLVAIGKFSLLGLNQRTTLGSMRCFSFKEKFPRCIQWPSFKNRT